MLSTMQANAQAVGAEGRTRTIKATGPPSLPLRRDTIRMSLTPRIPTCSTIDDISGVTQTYIMSEVSTPLPSYHTRGTHTPQIESLVLSYIFVRKPGHCSRGNRNSVYMIGHHWTRKCHGWQITHRSQGLGHPFPGNHPASPAW